MFILPAVSEEQHVFKPLEKDVYDEWIITSPNLINYVANFAEIYTSVPFQKCFMGIVKMLSGYLKSNCVITHILPSIS